MNIIFNIHSTNHRHHNQCIVAAVAFVMADVVNGLIFITDCIPVHRLNTLQSSSTVYPKKYAHGFCFAVLCCGYTLTDFPISIRLTSLALWQSNDCPSASKATLMNMDKYFMWIHYERLHNHNKAKHNKTVCIFLGIYCISQSQETVTWQWHHMNLTASWITSKLCVQHISQASSV